MLRLATSPGFEDRSEPPRRAAGYRGARLEIGLLNNMPDAALASTERQFVRLLDAASADCDITLRLYGLDEVQRSPETRALMARTYHDLDSMRLSPPDALIVTGAEPRAPALGEEPYWGALTGLIDWASVHTHSLLLSCLAAHAGVLHLDGIERRPTGAKCSGVFALDVVGDHQLVAGLGDRYLAPHSRFNGLDEGALRQAGYDILTRSPDIGVDIFMKERGCAMVFVQGHPEYDDDSLAREYRRDMARFLRGERASRPTLPLRYYGPAAMAALEAFETRAVRERSPDLVSDFPAVEPGEALWRKSGIEFYRSWLRLIADRKNARQARRAVAGRRPAAGEARDGLR